MPESKKMNSFLEKLGRRSIRMLTNFGETIAFAARVFRRIFRRKTYTSAMREVLINQIYFTSVQILPVLLLVSIVFGSLLIGIVFTMLKELGLTQYIGHVLMGLIVTELCPLLTVLLITLRSSAAINTEMAVMKVNQEIRTLEMFHIDIMDYLLAPRVMNGIISIVLLSSLFSIVLLASGNLFSWLMLGMSMDVYSKLLLNSTNFSDIWLSLFKCTVYGFFITLIPIRFGLRASRELTSIPIVVSQGMVNVFSAIVIIEVLSLILKLL
jgi:phospholipid/cholesterol/gamma-HCH transport system permease protein